VFKIDLQNSIGPAAAGGHVVEYCNGEEFEPRCHGNDVIVMLSARYGRMKIGRCVKREPGFEPMLQDPRYLGCSADVLHTVSTLCSGKSQCTLRVNDQILDNVIPCYDNLKMYLEVAYICVGGVFDCLLYLNINKFTCSAFCWILNTAVSFWCIILRRQVYACAFSGPLCILNTSTWRNANFVNIWGPYRNQ